MKRTVSAMEARRSFGELLDGVRLRGDEVIIERNGKVMGVIVPEGQHQILEQNRHRLKEVLDELWSRTADLGLTEEEVDREVQKAIREVRAAARKTRKSA